MNLDQLKEALPSFTGGQAEIRSNGYIISVGEIAEIQTVDRYGGTTLIVDFAWLAEKEASGDLISSRSLTRVFTISFDGERILVDVQKVGDGRLEISGGAADPQGINLFPPNWRLPEPSEIKEDQATTT